VKQSAGSLLYRYQGETLEVLLVRPSGPAARFGWSIPKGLPDTGESFVDAARRETQEEAGVVAGPLEELGAIDYVKSRKRVHCFFGPAPRAAEPRVASWEVSEARFIPVERAREILHVDQRAFIDMLVARLAPKSQAQET
jgi:predicted NUDIX family NTP pyrophosphohydrolase